MGWADSEGHQMKRKLDSMQRKAIDNLARRFCPQYESLDVLAVGRGTVCEIRCGPASFILKARAGDAGLWRSVFAEAEWIAYLHHNGIRVPRLVRSESGQLVEREDFDGVLLAGYCYDRVPIDCGDREYWYDSGFIQELGGTVGRMHTLAESYEPAEPENVPSWDSAAWIRDPEEAIHPSQTGVIGRIFELREQLYQLGKRRENYGLIHDDLHTGNVFKQGTDPVILDFDCSHRSWFIADISSALLFRTWIGRDREKPEVREMALHFLRNLLLGYLKEHKIEGTWREQLPLFLRLREINLFQSSYADVDIGRTQGDALLQYVYRSIADDRPFLDIDLGSIV